MTPEGLSDLHARTMRVPRPWTAAEFAALLSAPGVFLVGNPDAFALGRVAADEAELLTIATDPSRRRRGLGRSSLARFEAEARRRGATSAFLEVVEDNHVAQALYEAAGWVRSGRRHGYYRAPDGPALDALVMTKSLGQA